MARKNANGGHPESDLLALWSTALTLEAGLSIKTDNRKLLMNQLYRARQSGGTAEMEDLCISIPEAEGEVWIVKKTVLEAGDA